jgi:hypothetical protein
MITVGAVRELAYMSQHLGVPLYIAIDAGGKHLSLKVEENSVHISYQGQRIWEENIYGEGNWFGIESCDSIAKIINCINDGEPWAEKYGWEKTETTIKHVPFDEALQNAEES